MRSSPFGGFASFGIELNLGNILVIYLKKGVGPCWEFKGFVFQSTSFLFFLNINRPDLQRSLSHSESFQIIRVISNV